jgi:Cu/Zn superoxide dismutase
MAEARFMSPVAGSVYFHSLRQGEQTETKIFTNLYHVGGAGEGGSGKGEDEDGGATTSSDHPWQIFITDILGSNRKRQSCNFLQILYDPENRAGSGTAAAVTDCSQENPERCPAGNLTGKFDRVRVGKQESMFTKKYYSDQTLSLPPDLDGSSRSLYLAVFDPDHKDSFYACAQIHTLSRRTGRALFRQDGISGSITLTQSSLFHPVVATVNLTGLSGGAGSYHIHDFPVPLRLRPNDAPCGQTGGHFNPFSADKSSSPPSGLGTSDQYEVGDLSGKYGELNNQFQVQGRWVDPSLVLFGSRSVLGRSIVIHKSPVPLRWVCANIELEGADTLTAVVTFVYPVAGRIFFRQDQSSPLADTTVYVEGLLYSDGSRNATDGHKWHVHEDVPGKDFFNWTGRCLSAGKHFNPYQISKDER